ncbi:MAG: RNA 2'-phosphotransferase [Deltaproteobacteria bacterium]|nr:RNA 2'-phosphotransferase [Deltaproteobacteria bacterium]
MVTSERLSRFMTFLLRHRPADYSLSFDRQGYVPWDDLVQILRRRFPELNEQDIVQVIDGSEKKRFELRGTKVRATYGHSFPVDLGLERTTPPIYLYHGTARDLAETILREGLKPRGREYVHLSQSIEEALAVGKRRDPVPAILLIDALSAHQNGIVFYASGPVFLSKEIPRRFIRVAAKTAAPVNP